MEKLAKQASESGAFQQESIKTLSEMAVQVAEKAQAGSVELSSKVTEEIQKLSQEVQQSFASLSSASSALVESQGRLISEIENRVVRENEASSDLAEGISNAASLMRVNQSEFAAGLEMFNKGLELIEVVWLFSVSPDMIDIVVHRESIVHSLIEYDDNSVIAQLGHPDMRLPI